MKTSIAYMFALLLIGLPGSIEGTCWHEIRTGAIAHHQDQIDIRQGQKAQHYIEATHITDERIAHATRITSIRHIEQEITIA